MYTIDTYLNSSCKKTDLPSQEGLTPTISDDKRIDLDSRRYIGNKAKLTPWIVEKIMQHTGGINSFFDVFAGSASVSKAMIPHARHIIMNDLLYSNQAIYQAFFAPEEYREDLLLDILKYYNHLNPAELPDNYFSINFGDKYFEKANAKLIGYFRENIELLKPELTNKEYNILLTTLIYNIDKIANTVGHFDAYIKKPIANTQLQFHLTGQLAPQEIEIYREDANILVPHITADVAYVDPPYNSRQYSRFYHVYENLVTWKKPQLYGVAMKPEPENMSAYCRTNAREAFQDLITHLRTRYIAVSYNNTYKSKSHSSQNKISLNEIETILNQKGNTTVYECNHRYFNAGKTAFDDHKELLFITETR